jgi:hypothetical protein
MIHIEGQPAPQNPTNNRLLRIRSRANWLAISAMDTENVISFRPSSTTRRLGKCHIDDLQAAVEQKAKRDCDGLTTLANTLQNTLGDPYGSLSRGSTLANNHRMQQSRPQDTDRSFNPPIAPRSMLPSTDSSTASGPVNGRMAGRQQSAVAPAVQCNPRTMTHPLPERPELPITNGTGTCESTQQQTASGQPRTNGTRATSGGFDSGYGTHGSNPSPSVSPPPPRT